MTNDEIQALASALLQDSTFTSRIIGAVVRNVAPKDEIYRRTKGQINNAIDQAISASNYKQAATDALNSAIAEKINRVRVDIETRIDSAMAENAFFGQDHVKIMFTEAVNKLVYNKINAMISEVKETTAAVMRQKFIDALQKISVNINLSDLITKSDQYDCYDGRRMFDW